MTFRDDDNAFGPFADLTANPWGDETAPLNGNAGGPRANERAVADTAAPTPPPKDGQSGTLAAFWLGARIIKKGKKRPSWLSSDPNADTLVPTSWVAGQPATGATPGVCYRPLSDDEEATAAWAAALPPLSPAVSEADLASIGDASDDGAGPSFREKAKRAARVTGSALITPVVAAGTAVGAKAGEVVHVLKTTAKGAGEALAVPVKGATKAAADATKAAARKARLRAMAGIEKAIDQPNQIVSHLVDKATQAGQAAAAFDESREWDAPILTPAQRAPAVASQAQLQEKYERLQKELLNKEAYIKILQDFKADKKAGEQQYRKYQKAQDRKSPFNLTNELNNQTNLLNDLKADLRKTEEELQSASAASTASAVSSPVVSGPYERLLNLVITPFSEAADNQTEFAAQNQRLVAEILVHLLYPGRDPAQLTDADLGTIMARLHAMLTVPAYQWDRMVLNEHDTALEARIANLKSFVTQFSRVKPTNAGVLPWERCSENSDPINFNKLEPAELLQALWLKGLKVKEQRVSPELLQAVDQLLGETYTSMAKRLQAICMLAATPTQINSLNDVIEPPFSKDRYHAQLASLLEIKGNVKALSRNQLLARVLVALYAIPSEHHVDNKIAAILPMEKAPHEIALALLDLVTAHTNADPKSLGFFEQSLNVLIQHNNAIRAEIARRQTELAARQQATETLQQQLAWARAVNQYHQATPAAHTDKANAASSAVQAPTFTHELTFNPFADTLPPPTTADAAKGLILENHFEIKIPATKPEPVPFEMLRAPLTAIVEKAASKVTTSTPKALDEALPVALAQLAFIQDVRRPELGMNGVHATTANQFITDEVQQANYLTAQRLAVTHQIRLLSHLLMHTRTLTQLTPRNLLEVIPKTDKTSLKDKFLSVIDLNSPDIVLPWRPLNNFLFLIDTLRACTNELHKMQRALGEDPALLALYKDRTSLVLTIFETYMVRLMQALGPFEVGKRCYKTLYYLQEGSALDTVLKRLKDGTGHTAEQTRFVLYQYAQHYIIALKERGGDRIPEFQDQLTAFFARYPGFGLTLQTEGKSQEIHTGIAGGERPGWHILIEFMFSLTSVLVLHEASRVLDPEQEKHYQGSFILPASKLDQVRANTTAAQLQAAHKTAVATTPTPIVVAKQLSPEEQPFFAPANAPGEQFGQALNCSSHIQPNTLLGTLFHFLLSVTSGAMNLTTLQTQKDLNKSLITSWKNLSDYFTSKEFASAAVDVHTLKVLKHWEAVFFGDESRLSNWLANLLPATATPTALADVLQTRDEWFELTDEDYLPGHLDRLLEKRKGIKEQEEKAKRDFNGWLSFHLQGVAADVVKHLEGPKGEAVLSRFLSGVVGQELRRAFLKFGCFSSNEDVQDFFPHLMRKVAAKEINFAVALLLMKFEKDSRGDLCAFLLQGQNGAVKNLLKVQAWLGLYFALILAQARTLPQIRAAMQEQAIQEVALTKARVALATWEKGENYQRALARLEWKRRVIPAATEEIIFIEDTVVQVIKETRAVELANVTALNTTTDRAVYQRVCFIATEMAKMAQNAAVKSAHRLDGAQIAQAGNLATAVKYASTPQKTTQFPSTVVLPNVSLDTAVVVQTHQEAADFKIQVLTWAENLVAAFQMFDISTIQPADLKQIGCETGKKEVEALQAHNAAVEQRLRDLHPDKVEYWGALQPNNYAKYAGYLAAAVQDPRQIHRLFIHKVFNLQTNQYGSEATMLELAVLFRWAVWIESVGSFNSDPTASRDNGIPHLLNILELMLKRFSKARIEQAKQSTLQKSQLIVEKAIFDDLLRILFDCKKPENADKTHAAFWRINASFLPHPEALQKKELPQYITKLMRDLARIYYEDEVLRGIFIKMHPQTPKHLGDYFSTGSVQESDNFVKDVIACIMCTATDLESLDLPRLLGYWLGMSAHAIEHDLKAANLDGIARKMSYVMEHLLPLTKDGQALELAEAIQPPLPAADPHMTNARKMLTQAATTVGTAAGNLSNEIKGRVAAAAKPRPGEQEAGGAAQKRVDDMARGLSRIIQGGTAWLSSAITNRAASAATSKAPPPPPPKSSENNDVVMGRSAALLPRIRSSELRTGQGGRLYPPVSAMPATRTSTIDDWNTVMAPVHKVNSQRRWFTRLGWSAIALLSVAALGCGFIPGAAASILGITIGGVTFGTALGFSAGASFAAGGAAFVAGSAVTGGLFAAAVIVLGLIAMGVGYYIYHQKLKVARSSAFGGEDVRRTPLSGQEASARQWPHYTPAARTPRETAATTTTHEQQGPQRRARDWWATR